MSRESLAQFLHQVAHDHSLQKKLAEFAAREGFVFEPSELSDVDLDSIAGGAGFIKRQ